MSLGVHFALSGEEVERLFGVDDPDDLVELISEEIEAKYLGGGEPRWAFQSDKAWDAIHRCLCGGELLYESGPFPLAYAVLGGEALDAGEDYTACLVRPEQVRKTAAALRALSREELRRRYEGLSGTDYAKYAALGDADFEYTWGYFEGLRAFFEFAAEAGRAVLFTTDC